MSSAASFADPASEKTVHSMSSATTLPSPDFSTITNTPAWFQERAKAAWLQYQALPLPGVKAEEWRYSNAKRLATDALQPAPLPTDAEIQQAIEKSTGMQEVAARFIFVNDQLVHSQVNALDQGVQVLPFTEALLSHGDVLEQYLMKRESELGSAKFAALHLAFVKAGVVVLVPKNAVLEKPVEIFHWVAGENVLVFPHTLVVAGEHAKVTVVDHHASLRDEAAQSIAVADLVAGQESKIQYINVQELAPSARALHISSTTVSRSAEVQALQLHLGASFTRSESVSDLIGENARSEMFGVSLPIGEQVVDMRTLQNHAAPHTFSDLLYKNSLADKTRSVFSGLINVAEGAHFTDAYQKCRNLLNSEDAEAVSMPGLEINADQVKCSHGATSAPISEDELFYLKARGIPDAASRHLIVLGFLEDVISRLGNEALIESLDQRIENKFKA